MEGWISLHRKIRKNPIFNDHELLRLWLICLTEATHKERDQIIGRQSVHLSPGEFVTGRFDLEAMYNDGLKRDQQKSPKTVWRWLESLETGQYLTIKSTNKYSVVAVLNWHIYQSNDHDNDQQVTNKRPTSDQQVTTNNNVNNLNNVNNSFVGDMGANEIEKYFCSKRGKGLQVSPDDYKAIADAIHFGITIDSIKRSLDQIFKEYKPKHPKDEIRTFSYCSSKIYDDWNRHIEKSKVGDNVVPISEGIRQGFTNEHDRPYEEQPEWKLPAKYRTELPDVSGH